MERPQPRGRAPCSRDHVQPAGQLADGLARDRMKVDKIQTGEHRVGKDEQQPQPALQFLHFKADMRSAALKYYKSSERHHQGQQQQNEVIDTVGQHADKKTGRPDGELINVADILPDARKGLINAGGSERAGIRDPGSRSRGVQGHGAQPADALHFQHSAYRIGDISWQYLTIGGIINTHSRQSFWSLLLYMES